MKKTVTNIVQKLLDSRHITAEEAIILLKGEVNCNSQTIINPPSNIPVNTPKVYPNSPQIWYTSDTVNPETIDTLNNNFTSK